MKTQHRSLATSLFTDDRLRTAQAHLSSSIADAAAQGTIEESQADRLTRIAVHAPQDDIDREITTVEAERLHLAMSYINDLHSQGRIETDLVRTIYGATNPALLCTVAEVTKRDIRLIEYRLDASVRAGSLDETTKAAILAKPYLNHQAADALQAFSAIATRDKQEK
jgi:hypothetical protein